jgi:hypothetical protein
LPRIIQVEMQTAGRKVHSPKLFTAGYADLSRNPGFRLFLFRSVSSAISRIGF